MATSTPPKPEAPKAERIAYPEEDKLGPLGSARTSTLHEPAELRARLMDEFEAAVAATKAAAAFGDEGSANAVHVSRKALRRARAVLAMMAGALPKSERRAVRRALQDARRSLSTVRDHAVAPETLGGLELDAEARDTAKRVLDAAAESIPPVAEIKQLLGEAATRAAAQAEALAAALPGEVSWDVLADGIADTYSSGRRARRLAKHSKQWFHTWRRRSKEFVYQLDFVAAHAGARTLAIRAELDALTDLLGPAVDRIMLREFVTTHAQGLDVDRLRDEIEGDLDSRMKEARKAGRDAFSQKPKKFVRRLARAVERDLTPVDENGHTPDAD